MVLNNMTTSLSTTKLGKNTFTFSTGNWAKQAHGSICVSFGDTVVLATVCMTKDPLPGKDFFPLMVDYQERTYSAGKIPGGFFKKEGRPKDKEILTSRLIDRPLRPLFPKGMTNEVQVIAMVLSSDGENDPDILAVNAASCALLVSDIPFNDPVGAVRVSKIEGKFVINPDYQQRELSTIDLIFVGTDSRIVMIEGALAEILEEEVLEAIKFATPFIKESIDLQRKVQAKIGKKKREVPLSCVDKDLLAKITKKVSAKIEKSFNLTSKEEKQKNYAEILASLTEEFLDEASQVTESKIKSAFFALEEEIIRESIINKGTRPDGRKLDEIRALDSKIRVLPRTHGSAVFTRGQTQALAITTLGSSSDEQLIESLSGKSYKHFTLHYSFPPFSVGEVKFLRGSSRREIGHGALAEKAILPVLPAKADFPYTVRVVSEILESNGSSSMASVCATSLSLMDAGVPIKAPVAGIAMGLFTKGDKYKVLTDIAGAEDHCGDMDFKVAGTKEGITAIQMDTKIGGISFEMIKETLQRAKEAREFILNKMETEISNPRDGLSEYAPKIRSFPVAPEKIGAIIGPGGKIIKRIQRENNVNIDIDDDTSVVSVVAMKLEDLERAATQINNLVKDVEVGKIYDVVVEKVVAFGAFCEIAPGKSGLLHVSELADTFVKDPSEFLKEGDKLKVKVIGIDPQGKIKISLKQAKSEQS